MSQMDARSTFALTPWVRRLIAANAVVYLLTITRSEEHTSELQSL